MYFTIRKKQVIFLLWSMCIYCLLGFVLITFFGITGTVLFATLGIALILFLIFDRFERIQNEQINIYREIQSLIGLYRFVDPALPLPPMRDYAASPSHLLLLAEEVYRRKPNLVVECGSGVSTLVISYVLNKLGSGRIVSLDHDPKYAEITKQALVRHGLDHFVDIRIAPLQDVTLPSGIWKWYSTESVDDLYNIDLLTVDGPPGPLQKLSRYPAGPFLFPKLTSDAVVILDDAARRDERIIVNKWKKKYGPRTVEYTGTEGGTALLRF